MHPYFGWRREAAIVGKQARRIHRKVSYQMAFRPISSHVGTTGHHSTTNASFGTYESKLGVIQAANSYWRIGFRHPDAGIRICTGQDDDDEAMADGIADTPAPIQPRIRPRCRILKHASGAGSRRGTGASSTTGYGAPRPAACELRSKRCSLRKTITGPNTSFPRKRTIWLSK